MSIKTLDILLFLKTKLAVQNLWKLFVIKKGKIYQCQKNTQELSSMFKSQFRKTKSMGFLDKEQKEAHC